MWTVSFFGTCSVDCQLPLSTCTSSTDAQCVSTSTDYLMRLGWPPDSQTIKVSGTGETSIKRWVQGASFWRKAFQSCGCSNACGFVASTLISQLQEFQNLRPQRHRQDIPLCRWDLRFLIPSCSHSDVDATNPQEGIVLMVMKWVFFFWVLMSYATRTYQLVTKILVTFCAFSSHLGLEHVIWVADIFATHIFYLKKPLDYVQNLSLLYLNCISYRW